MALTDEAIDKIKDMIISGELAPGDRLPKEAELAQRLGLSRSSLREAVKALCLIRVLDVRQGDGTYVRATSEVSGAIRRLCGEELREVLQVRRMLEVEAARLAATDRTDEELANLRALHTQRDKAQAESRFADFVQTDADFHLAVVACAHNTLLTELYRGLTEAITASVAATTHQELGPAEHIEHRGIIDAIADRDPTRAATEAAAFLDELLADL
jgi:DNA-binding FadR family transcriptional regulator